MIDSSKWATEVLQITFGVEACSMSLWLDGEDTLKMEQTLGLLKVRRIKRIYLNLLLEIMDSVSFNWTSIVKEVGLWATSKQWIIVPGHKIKWRKIQTYTACQSIDVVDYFDFEKYTPLQLQIRTYRIENFGFSVYIEERNKVTFLLLDLLSICNYF